MTPEERARQIADDTYAQLEYGGAVLVYCNHEKKEETFEQAIAAAIREERDAIAAITDHWARVHAGVIGEMFARLSEVIRART